MVVGVREKQIGEGSSFPLSRQMFGMLNHWLGQERSWDESPPLGVLAEVLGLCRTSVRRAGLYP